MVLRLIPHRSSKILLCSYFCLSSVNSLLCSYSYPSSVNAYCVLIPVRLPSIPRIVLLLTNFLVPSLIVGYCPTHGMNYCVFSVKRFFNMTVGVYFQRDSRHLSLVHLANSTPKSTFYSLVAQ